jgi:phenol 2-monooxygenase
MIVAKGGDSENQGDGTDVLGKHTELRVLSQQDLAIDIKVGMRMPSFKVLNQADARPWHFQELLKSNGRWRLVIFAGNVADSSQHGKVKKLGEALGNPKSFLRRFTPANKSYDSVIEVLTVYSAPRHKATIFDFPEVFRPWSDRDGWDYWKIFVDDQSYHEGHGQAYKNYGIDPQKGCSVILRPDQYVSFVGEMDDYRAMDHFFSGFMIPQKAAKKVEVNGLHE